MCLYCSLFIFWCISSISMSENQLFFIVVLTWSTNLLLVVWKLAHSFSHIVFVKGCSSNSSVVQVGCLLLSMFCVFVFGCCVSLIRHSCSWKKISQHLQDDDWVSYVGYQESTCRSWPPSLVACVPRYVILSFDIFIMGGMLRLYQTLGSFIYVTENNHGDCSWTASHKKRKS